MAKARKTNTIVKKSNALIRGQWSIQSVWEPRLIALLASKVHVNDKDFKVYKIPIIEVTGGEHGGKNYKELESIIENLMGRVVSIRESPTRVCKYNVFSKCVIDTKTGILELGFHPDLRRHYLDLGKRFTQYNLAEFVELPSIYSQRIYEILKSWDDRDEVTINIDELNNMLDTPKSFRADFKAFRVKVLEKAHRDITQREGSTLWFDWEAVRKGARKVTAIRFLFRRSFAELLPEKTAVDPIIDIQKESTACWQKHRADGVECKPDMRTKRCQYCTSRGPIFAKTQAEEEKKYQDYAFCDDR